MPHGKSGGANRHHHRRVLLRRRIETVDEDDHAFVDASWFAVVIESQAVPLAIGFANELSDAASCARASGRSAVGELSRRLQQAVLGRRRHRAAVRGRCRNAGRDVIRTARATARKLIAGSPDIEPSAWLPCG